MLSRTSASLTRNTILAAFAVVAIVLPSFEATADEALYIHGIPQTGKRHMATGIGARTPEQMPYLRSWLYFPHKAEFKANNLVPDLKTRKRRDLGMTYPAASPQGRMLLLSYEIVQANNFSDKAPVWRHAARVLSPSPFRNRPWNQNPPVLTLEKPIYGFMGSERDPGLAFRTAQWAPDGKRFLLRYTPHKGRDRIEIRHAGGGPLITLTETSAISVRWGNDSRHLAVKSNDKNDPTPLRLVKLPERKGTYSLPALLRNGRALPVQSAKMSFVYPHTYDFSPDGKQLVVIRQTTVRPNVQRFEFLVGSLDRTGSAFHVQGDYTNKESGRGKTYHKESTTITHELFGVGWSQDSSAYYFIREQSRKDYKVDNPTKHYSTKFRLIASELWRWTAKTGARKVMNLDHMAFHRSNPHIGRGSVISEDHRFLAYWGHPTGKGTKWEVRGTGRNVYLVVVDLKTKTTRRVFNSGSKWDWAAFIKTQKDDPDRTRDDDNTVKPDLPQHFVEKNGDLSVVTSGTARFLRIPFRGRAFQFEGKWDQVNIEFSFFDAKGKPLKATDQGPIRDTQGHVVATGSLAARPIRREGDHFRGVVNVPLTQLNIAGDKAMRLQLRMSLKTTPKDRSVKSRTLVRTKLIPFTLSKEDVPRLRTSGETVGFYKGKTTGKTYVSWKGNLHLRGLKSQDVHVEMVVMLPDGTRIATRDAKYRAKDGHAARIRKYRPRFDKSRIGTRLIIPYENLKLPRGTREIRVFVRARQGNKYVGTFAVTTLPIKGQKTP